VSNLAVQISGASLQVIDNTAQLVRINTVVATMVASATASFYESYFQVGAGSTSLVLPVSPVWAVYIKNLHASNTVSVTCTPTGGNAWVSPIVLPAGGVFMYWVPYASNPATGGFSVISLQASGAATPVEILLAS
jgi:hypothetical protein